MPKFPTHKDDVEFPSLEKVRKAQEKGKAATERQKQHEQRTMLDLMKTQASPMDRITRIPQLEKRLGIEEEPGEGVGRRFAMQQIMEREAEKQEQERKKREMIPSYDLKRRTEEGDMPRIEAYEAPQDRGITERIGDWFTRQKEQPVFSRPTERAKISYEEFVPRSTQRSIQDFITKQTTDRGIGLSQITTGRRPEERGTYYTDERGVQRFMPAREEHIRPPIMDTAREWEDTLKERLRQVEEVRAPFGLEDQKISVPRKGPGETVKPSDALLYSIVPRVPELVGRLPAGFANFFRKNLNTIIAGEHVETDQFETIFGFNPERFGVDGDEVMEDTIKRWYDQFDMERERHPERGDAMHGSMATAKTIIPDVLDVLFAYNIGRAGIRGLTPH